MRRLALVLAALAFVVVLWSLSRGARAHGVEACLSFGGRSACGTAWAPSREDALRAAVGSACGSITTGVGAAVACRQTRPSSVRWLTPDGR